MAPAKRRVLMTGGSGYVASLMREEFAAKYDLVLADVTNKDRNGNTVVGVNIVDLGDTDRTKYQHLFDGVDGRKSTDSPLKTRTSLWRTTSIVPHTTPEFDVLS